MTRPFSARLIATTAATAGLLFAASAAPAPAAEVVRVVTQNQPLPGDAGEVIGSTFYGYRPAVSRTGDVLLSVPIAPASNPNGYLSHAVLLWHDGQPLRTLLRPGTPLNGQEQVFGIGIPTFSANGRYVASVYLGDQAINPNVIPYGLIALDLQDPSGQWARLVPFASPDYYPTDRIFANDAGRYAFTIPGGQPIFPGAPFTPPDERFVAGTPGDLKQIVRVGDALPGGETANLLHPLGFNPAGQSLFAHFTAYTPAGTPDTIGIYRHDPAVVVGGDNSLSRVAARNDAAPGIPGASFASFELPPVRFAFSDTGRTAFAAAVAGPGVTPTTDQGIWAGGPAGPLQLVAREGSIAPGLGKPFLAFPAAPQVSAEGHVLFLATHDFVRDRFGFPFAFTADALWISDPGDPTVPRRLAAPGDTVPGVPGVIDGINEYVLGENGIVAFTAAYGLPDSTAKTGLWVGRPGDLHLLLTEGDAFQVDGRAAQVASIQIDSGASSSKSESLHVTDDGRVLVTLQYSFSDASGNAVEYGNGLFLVGIPEPTSAATLLPLLSLTASRRRRR